nr:ribosomal protein L22 [Paeonia brownii]
MIRKRKKNRYTEVSAIGSYMRISVQKARRVVDQIRGRSYEEALMILDLMPYRARFPIFKLLYSAVANARHNMGFHPLDLVICKAEVNKGSTKKKLKLRARGCSYPIKRPTCHITIVLKNRFLNEEYEIWRREPQNTILLEKGLI